MGWSDKAKNWTSEKAGALTETFTEAVSTTTKNIGTALDTTVHTFAVVADGIEEGVGSLGGVIVGGIGDIANATVKGAGNAAEWAGIEGAGELQLYEGGFGTGISRVNTAITESLDDVQAFLVDKPINWALKTAGIDYELQYARPPLRNSFDRVVFGTAKTGTEVIGGILIIAATGGAAGAIGIGSATTAGLVTSSVTGAGLYITTAATTYSLYSNINDQFEASEQRRAAMETLLEAGFGTPTSSEDIDVKILEPMSVESLMDKTLGSPPPTMTPALR
jgi:hypothetical protein